MFVIKPSSTLGRAGGILDNQALLQSCLMFCCSIAKEQSFFLRAKSPAANKNSTTLCHLCGEEHPVPPACWQPGGVVSGFCIHWILYIFC